MRYFIICILGWFLGSYANELIEREIKGETECVPPSRIFQRLRLPRMIKPIDRSLRQWKWFLCGKPHKRKTAVRGLLVELTVILAAQLVNGKYGYTTKGLGAFLFIYALIIISMVDLTTMLIPNRLTLILGIMHLIFMFLGWSVTWEQAIEGALLGGGILLGVGYLSQAILRKEGLGGGDIKLILACGLYLGPARAMFGLLCAVYLAGLLLLLLLMAGRVRKNQYIPFGPFMSGGFAISLFYYEEITGLLFG